MRRRTSVMTAALLAVVLAAPAAIAFDRDAQRNHDHKRANPVASAAVPTETTTSVECVDGEAAGFPCDGIDLLAFVPASEFSGLEVSAFPGLSDNWGWTDPDNGDEYVLQGASNGVHVFRVTDPTAPVYLGILRNTAPAQLFWYDIKVMDHYALVVSESAPHNMRVFDLHDLRGVESAQEFFETTRYPLSVSQHNIAVNQDTGFAYVVGGNVGLFVPDQCSAGLHMIDVNDPTSPEFAGCYGEDDYIHDTQCVIYEGPDAEHRGKELCFNANEDTFSVVDVTDKANPVRLGLLEYPQTGYTHQGWLTEDQGYFLLGDELDEQDFGINTRTLILDVTDIDAPTLVSEYLHDNTSIDHNMYVRDGMVFQSNYASGLRVFDTSAVADGELLPLAFFDTFPEHDDAEFAGTWNNYPFFESGTIAVSGTNEGLFLVKLRDDVVAGEAPTQPAPVPAPEPQPAADDSALPATGGGLALAGLLALAGAAIVRRRA